MDSYLGATAQELREAGGTARFLGSIMPGNLFPHHGQIVLNGAMLSLAGWRTLSRTDVASVGMRFDETYSRWQAGGIGPNGPAIGFFKGGEPLIMTLRDGTAMYLSINRHALTGATENADWLQRLEAWLQKAE